VNVTGEVDIVDPGAFERDGLLRTDIWREEQKLVVGVIARQLVSAAVQVLDHDTNVLVAEVPFFLHKVPDRATLRLPGNETIETSQGCSGLTDLGLWHPVMENGPIQVETRRCLQASHVQYNIVFINNEQRQYMNKSDWSSLEELP
jgi:hypothetical protein